MAIAPTLLVSGSTTTSTTNPASPAIGSAVPIGDVIIACLATQRGAAPTGCTDTKGNTYTLAKYQQHGTGTAGVAIYVAPVTVALTSTDTVGITQSAASTTGIVIQVYRARGVSGTPDQVGGAQGTQGGAFGSNAVTTAGATASNHELSFSFGCQVNTASSPAGGTGETTLANSSVSGGVSTAGFYHPDTGAAGSAEVAQFGVQASLQWTCATITLPLTAGIGFVQTLGTAQNKTAGTTLVFSGSAEVVVGDSIFISVGIDNATTPSAVSVAGTATTDAGSYSAPDADSGTTQTVMRTSLIRVNVTGAGTVTGVTVTHASQTARAGVVAIFKGVGALSRAGHGGSAGTVSPGPQVPVTGGLGIATLATGECWIVARAWEGLSSTFSALTKTAGWPDLGIEAGRLGTTGGSATSNITGQLVFQTASSATVSGTQEAETTLTTATNNATAYGVYASSGATFTGSASDSVAFSDSAARTSLSLVTRSAPDSVTFADSAPRSAMAYVRVASDGVTVADAASGVVVHSFVSSASDSASFSDAATRAALTRARAVSDGFTATDIATRLVALVRASSDSATFSDLATRLLSNPRVIADAFSVSDAAVRTALTRARAASEGFTATDIASRLIADLRGSSDAVAFSDIASRLTSDPRAVTDAFSVSDAVVRGALARARAASDAFTASDLPARTAQSFARVGGDSFTATDAASGSAIRSLTASASDSVTLSDAAIRALALVARSTADSFALSDSVSRLVGDARSVSDSFTTTDAATRAALVRSRGVADSFSVSDSAVRQPAPVRAAADSFTATDIATRVYTRIRGVSDNVAFSDSALRSAQAFLRATGDSVTVSDAAGRAALANLRATADSLAIADSALRASLVRLRAANDTVTLADSASRSRPALIRVASDALAVSDLASAVVVAFHLTAFKLPTHVTLDSRATLAALTAISRSAAITAVHAAAAVKSHKTTPSVTAGDRKAVVGSPATMVI